MHSYDCFLFNSLQGTVRLLLLLLTHISTSAKFCEAGDDEVADLVELGVAAHKEHVPSDSIRQHLLPSDSIVTKCQEDPTNICLDLCISNDS